MRRLRRQAAPEWQETRSKSKDAGSYLCRTTTRPGQEPRRTGMCARLLLRDPPAGTCFRGPWAETEHWQKGWSSCTAWVVTLGGVEAGEPYCSPCPSHKGTEHNTCSVWEPKPSPKPRGSFLENGALPALRHVRSHNQHCPGVGLSGPVTAAPRLVPRLRPSAHTQAQRSAGCCLCSGQTSSGMRFPPQLLIRLLSSLATLVASTLRKITLQI